VLIYLMLSSRFFGEILSSPLFNLSSYLKQVFRGDPFFPSIQPE
jgi:hypothetical protein